MPNVSREGDEDDDAALWPGEGTITWPGRRPAAGCGAPRVVVTGAGFGGLAAVRQLARAGTWTTLLDRNIYATFQPLLYQLRPAGWPAATSPTPSAPPRRYGAVYRHGELADIDPAARQVTLADGARLGYDYLILTTGVTAAYHGIPGASRAQPEPVHPP